MLSPAELLINESGICPGKYDDALISAPRVATSKIKTGN